jgi:cardiolipin synthase
MTPSSIPNAITIARLVVSLPLLWLLMSEQFLQAFWLALIAGLSDALDGFLARRFGWRSALGGILDPIADKLLISVCFFGLWWTGHLPTWLVAVVLIRDVIILLGAWVWWRMNDAFEAAPTTVSKLTTLFQLVLIALTLAHLAGFEFADALTPPLRLATAAITVISGVDYIVRYGVRAWHLRRSRR